MTALKKLTQATKDAQRKRLKPAKPIKPSDEVERYYHAQLGSLVRAMAKEVNAEVMPAIKAERDDYTDIPDRPALTIDALYTQDDWARRIIDAINRVKARYFTPAFEAAYNRIARTFVSRTDETTTRQLVKNVNTAIGVDIRPLLSERDMDDYIQASIAENVSLIKSIPDRFFARIETTIYDGLKNGTYPSVIADQLQAGYGVTYRQARFIARDQQSKITSQIVEKRQQQAGITHYRAIDSGDERTTGNPSGKYPNAKISCWGIARKDIGFGKGVYTWKEGASWGGQSGLHPGRHHPGCRCTASPVFSWELPDNKKPD